MRVNDRRYRVGRIVKTVDELESQRNQQRNAQQQECGTGRMMHMAYVCDQVRERIHDANCKQPRKDEDSDLVRAFVDLVVYRRGDGCVRRWGIQRCRCSRHELSFLKARVEGEGQARPCGVRYYAAAAVIINSN